MRKLSTFGGIAVTALGLATAAGMASPFSAGTVVVVRVGDGSVALTSAATAVFLEERSPVDGSLIQSIALPTAVIGANQPITSSGTATSEGFINLSSNQFLVYGGYPAIPGTASVTTSTGPRVVGRITLSGVIDTTTQLVDGNTGNMRSVTTSDGTNIWAGTSTGGTRYTTFGANAASTQVCSAPSNMRVVNVFNGQLYGSSGSGTFVNVFTIGTGLPTTSGQTATSLPGMPTTTGPSNYDYFFSNATTLYVADDRTAASSGGIQKWTFDGTTWTNVTTVGLGTSGARGLTGKVTAGVTTLWATSAGGGTPLYTIVDDGVSLTPTSLVSAGTNTAFRGVRVLPGTFGGTTVGACCALDGTCSSDTAAGCAASGGTYQGNFTDCGSVACPLPGACCFSGGTCLILASSQCTAQGGSYGGNGTSCATTNCGPRSGACCRVDGTCTTLASTACTTAGGTYRGDGTTCGTTACANFVSGHVVVLEVSSTAVNTGSSVLLRELDATGNTVQAVGLPTVRTETGNRALAVNGASTTEGELTRSTDGHYLVLTGYNLSDGTLGPGASTTSRVVGRIDSRGVVDTTTAFTDHTFEGSSTRGAASVDGSAFWLSGDASDLANRGIRYALLGANTSLQLNEDTTNNRDVLIANGNLYYSSGSTPTGVNQLGTGLPTEDGQLSANITGNANPQGFFFSDANTLYVGSNAGAGAAQPGVTKYTFDGSEWLLNYVMDGGLLVPIQQLTGVVSGSNVTLYGTTGEGPNSAATPDNRLFRIDDNGGSTSPYTLLATAQGTAVWKGVALAPVPTAAACYANCDHSTTNPFLNVADFTCFLQRYAAADSYANCDGSTQVPTLNVADFTCFLQKFAAGCSAP